MLFEFLHNSGKALSLSIGSLGFILGSFEFKSVFIGQFLERFLPLLLGLDDLLVKLLLESPLSTFQSTVQGLLPDRELLVECILRCLLLDQLSFKIGKLLALVLHIHVQGGLFQDQSLLVFGQLLLPFDQLGQPVIMQLLGGFRFLLQGFLQVVDALTMTRESLLAAVVARYHLGEALLGVDEEFLVRCVIQGISLLLKG